MSEAPLEEKLKRVPRDPGVYLWKDERGKVLYVGKAKVLRNRVRSYFQRVDDKDIKTRLLVARIRDVDWIVTDSEKEALILEATLIRKHKPHYNIKLRDDKRFITIKLGMRHPFPRLYVVRRVKRDGDVYYGPFSQAQPARETLRFLNSAFTLRKCSDRQFASRKRPCLQHQIGRCHAPCVGNITSEQYAKIVDRVRAFFSGRLSEVISDLTAEMQAHSKALEFEKAAHIRDRIAAIEQTLEKQKAADVSLDDRDVFGIYREGTAMVICQLYIRGGAVTGQRTFPFKNVEEDNATVLSQLLSLYYFEDAFIPAQILLPLEPEGGSELYLDWLSELAGKRIQMRVPQRGEAKQLVEMAARNAERQFAVRKSQLISKETVLTEIQRKLHLPHPPETMECFDVSNISGTLAVASLVRFAGGEPDKSGYRRYRLRLKNEPDDYAMMREVLTRRISRGINEGNLPDLLLIDGGKGHLNVALTVLAEHEVTNQPLAGIAKIKDRRPDDLGPEDKIYLPGRKNPVNLKKGSNELLLLQRLRDESHRFANEYHRRLRSKKMVASELDIIPGLGTAKKKALIKTLGSIKAIRQASVEQLTQAPGIGLKLAQTIVQHFHES